MGIQPWMVSGGFFLKQTNQKKKKNQKMYTTEESI